MANQVAKYPVILLAAGEGSRFGSRVPKVWHQYQKRLIWQYAVDAFQRAELPVTYLVVSPAFYDQARLAIDSNQQLLNIIAGGLTRSDSLLQAITEIARHENPPEWVYIHDAARPMIHHEDIHRLKQLMIETDADGIALANQATDTTYMYTEETDHFAVIDRKQLWQVQTPQAIRWEHAFNWLQLTKRPSVSDELSIILYFQKKIELLPASYSNLKLTYQKDWEIFQHWADSQNQ